MEKKEESYEEKEESYLWYVLLAWFIFMIRDSSMNIGVSMINKPSFYKNMIDKCVCYILIIKKHLHMLIFLIIQ